eukprot:Blabericola_migrator_1__3612@NODE_2078_length_3312_cov_12_430817_g1316_i0_p1_GENE_NODE_2078_length_3312_cov_12_430817_g1316_i0NODE_2078_length_3312_cov_12_430817_g1316_i0_p1_ORF_typecomplete_len502_score57_07_NODE_2078_length_3312_cov_12_430817_g1316_i011232628
MPRALILNASPHPGVSVGDVITLGLVCVAGDDVRSATVDPRSESSSQQQSSPINWRSECSTQHPKHRRSESNYQQRSVSRESNWRQPRNDAAGGKASSFNMRPGQTSSDSFRGSSSRSLTKTNFRQSSEGTRRGSYSFASPSSFTTHSWRREPSDGGSKKVTLYMPGSRAWLDTFQADTYMVRFLAVCSDSASMQTPDFFQITKDTSPDNVLETLRRVLPDVSGDYQNICANLFKAVEARLESSSREEESCKSLEDKTFSAVQQGWNQLIPAVKDMVKEIVFPHRERSGTADQSAAAPVNVDLDMFKEDKLRLQNRAMSEEQTRILCFLEPALTWLTLTADEYRSQHLLPNTMTLVSLIDVRTTWLRHHLMRRLSSIESMTDNKAAEYCATLLNDTRLSSQSSRKPGAPRCIHYLVRLKSRQQIAAALLKALDIDAYARSLNICLIIAVDILGRGHSECPASWQDIVPFFETKMARATYTEMREGIASKLRPWLTRLAKVR